MKMSEDEISDDQIIDDQGIHSLPTLISNQARRKISIKAMYLSNPNLTDNDLTVIRMYFPDIKRLRLSKLSINGSTLGHLPEGMRELCLYECINVTDRGLANLRDLVLLKGLRLENLNITGSGFSQLPRRLKILELIGCKRLTDDGIRELQLAIELEKLTILDSTITGSTFDQLPINLESLRLYMCKNVTDENLMLLSHLKNLVVLRIGSDTLNESLMKDTNELRTILPKLKVYEI